MVPPLDLGLERNKSVLNYLEDRAYVEFWIFQEGKEQFQRAVACAATHSVECRVDAVDPCDDRLDCVSKGKLLVVVGVNAQIFSRECIEIFFRKEMDLF